MERFATGESEYTPPENLVRLVKLGFAGTEANESESAIASLVYDSLLQPLAAGVRTGSVSTRQLVFEVEGLTVDLRFERQPQSSRIYASGQVLDKQAPLCWPGNATVVLWMGKEKVTAAEANKYGEFQFEFEATRDLRVSIATIDRKTLWIPLGSLD
ncbi:MAG TPA: hypothetical protein VEG30_07305 [Terriglobales bacterium]|nr:hypothetical protein [Terriglobales bacterium]